jgi:DNA-binding transcriptional LysR family regulator
MVRRDVRQVSWDEFRLVKAIADAQGLNGAAEGLGLNHSTVFRRLNALEEDLGAALFERSRSGYVLTPAGEEMVVLARRMAEDISEFERRVMGRDLQPSGELRVTVTDTMMTDLCAEPFAAFRKRYPAITLDIVIDNRQLNLSRRDADVAIRASNSPPETLIGRRIATIAWAVYAPRGYAGETTLAPETLAGPWIGFGDPIQSNNGARWLKANVPEEAIAVKINGVLGMTQAIASGLGLGVVPCFTAEARGDLIRIGAPIAEAASTLWLLTHPDLRGSARVRAFLDFMAAELIKRRALIECSMAKAA